MVEDEVKQSLFTYLRIYLLNLFAHLLINFLLKKFTILLNTTLIT